MPINFNLCKYSNECYVETGYFKGESLKSALNCDFKFFHSIEINKEYYNNGINEFKNKGLDENIFIHLGNSSNILDFVIKSIKHRTTFFLDAHDLTYPGIKTENFEFEDGCPILEEIRLISKHDIKNHTIIIDDIRMFNNSYGWAKDSNINSGLLENELLKINPDYKIVYENGYIDNDVLVAFI
jgi:hypothetical protein